MSWPADGTYERLDGGLDGLGRGPGRSISSRRPTKAERTRTSDRQERYSKEAMRFCRAAVEENLQLKVQGGARCGMQGCVWKVKPRLTGLRPQVLKLSMERMAYNDAAAALWLRLLQDGELRAPKRDPTEESRPVALPRLKRVGVGLLKRCLPAGFKGAPAFVTLREDLSPLPMRQGVRRALLLLDMMQTFVHDRRRGPPGDFIGRHAEEIERLPPFARKVFDNIAELQEWLYRRGLYLNDLGSPDGSNLGVRRWAGEIVARDVGMLAPLGRVRGGVFGARERALVRRVFQPPTSQRFAPILAGSG